MSLVFPSPLFPGVLYPSPLFPGSSGGASTPPDLVAAIIATGASDSTLSAITGGWFKDEATPPTPDVFAVVSQRSATLTYNGGTYTWNAVSLTIRIQAKTAALANSIGAQLLQSVPAWGSLDFQGGYTIPLVVGPKSSGKVKTRRSGDSAAWFFEATFNARTREGT